GFEGIGGASKIANLQAVEEVKESVQELVSEEMMRLGELVGRKEFGLAEAIAKERNERFFL
ncbi:MAG: hypothetical protein LBS68_03735, partial [Puniceicoccales bacterium]|nr:hypothetical protein [Puniceicoccales bacterium]